MSKPATKNIAVGKLAYFAAYPDRYKKHRGKAFNPEGAKVGTEYHKQLKPTHLFVRVFIVLALAWISFNILQQL